MPIHIKTDNAFMQMLVFLWKNLSRTIKYQRYDIKIQLLRNIERTLMKTPYTTVF